MPVETRTVRLSDLAWVADGDGGRSARIEVRSPNAYSLRVAMQLSATDPDLAVRFAGSAAGAQVFGPVPGNAIAQDTERFGQFWSPVLAGDVATIEFHAGPGVSVDALTLTLPRIAHQMVGNGELQVAVREDRHRNRSGAKLQHRRRLRHAHRSVVQREESGGAAAVRQRRRRPVPVHRNTAQHGADDQHALPVYRGALHEVREGRAYAQHAVVLRRGRMPQQRRSAVRPADWRRRAARPQPGP